MLIDAVELFHLRFPQTDSVLVRLQTGTQNGWGEACIGREPVESPEWAGSVFACLRDFLAPAVRGQSILSGEQLQEAISRFQGNAAAKSALDCAWWDLRAKTHATTVAAMLGGTRETFETSLTLEMMPTIDELLQAIETHEQKHAVLLLKYRPGWDEQMLRAVRQVFPAVPLAIDCDGCCELGQREQLYRLDDFMLRWIEQPFPADDLVAHAMLQEQIRTPVCLHQSITSLPRAEQALDLGSCRMLKLDPGLLGGITPTHAIYQSAAGNIPMTIAGRFATVAGAAAHRSLATLSALTQPIELGGCSLGESGNFIDEHLLNSAVDRVLL